MFYKEIIEAKNGTKIPLLQNGKTLESRYNPDRDADLLLNSISENYNFFIVTGISSGIFLKKLSEKFSKSVILAVEASEDDINFLMQIKIIQELKKNQNIIFSSINKLCETVINYYNPVYFGDFKIIEQKNWINENQEAVKKLQLQLQNALNVISADYSTQAFFGKIWQNNIINNVKLINDSELKLNIDTNKTAVIVAAGPTLDSSISTLKNEDFYIIATDTAFTSLVQQNIIPDVVVSIDGQSVSFNHFKHFTEQILNKTVFLMDLCCNYSVVKKLTEKKAKILFSTSNHPLSVYANEYCKNSFIKLFSGSGTVTITAFDFACQCGFKNIEVYGADFCYSNGKPYTKGTYLDFVYGKSSERLCSIEQTFDKLMYRSKLIKLGDNKFTTQVLSSYKTSFEDFLNSNNIDFKIENHIYKTKNNLKNVVSESFAFKKLVITDFIHNIPDIAFLPYVAWLRKKTENNKKEFSELCKLARKSLVRYN